MSSHTAVITGSTAGLGASFARQLAAQGYHLILVARDGDRLRAQAGSLSKQYGIKVSIIVADLVTDDGVGAVQERLADPRNPVHLLVNNAGHGLATEFIESSLDEERDLLRLHVQTTMELSHTAARAMVRRRAGRIINVASVAGFTPTGTYSAAKSWVINFSKALHQQLRGDGVVVTALCPGLVRTEFHERSGIKIKGTKRWMWLEADDVVRQGLAANAQGASTCVPSRSYRLMTGALKFMPDSMVQWAAGRRMGVPGQEESAGELEAGPSARQGGRQKSEDGTAEPTTDAINTVNAYKASKRPKSPPPTPSQVTLPPPPPPRPGNGPSAEQQSDTSYTAVPQGSRADSTVQNSAGQNSAEQQNVEQGSPEGNDAEGNNAEGNDAVQENVVEPAQQEGAPGPGEDPEPSTEAISIVELSEAEIAGDATGAEEAAAGGNSAEGGQPEDEVSAREDSSSVEDVEDVPTGKVATVSGGSDGPEGMNEASVPEGEQEVADVPEDQHEVADGEDEIADQAEESSAISDEQPDGDAESETQSETQREPAAVSGSDQAVDSAQKKNKNPLNK